MKRAIATVKGWGGKIAAGVVMASVFGARAFAQDFESRNVAPIQMAGDSIYDIVDNLVKIVLIGAGIIAVLYLIYGGIMYITAGGDAEKATKGRTAITNAIIGIIIIAAAFAIYTLAAGAANTGSIR